MRVLPAYVLCCTFLLASVISCLTSEKNRCKERQILNTIDRAGFYREEYCNVEIHGRSLRKTDCTVWDFGEGDGYHDCSDLQFSSLSSSYVLGTKIHPYVEAFPNFIISFKDIKWNYMQYRLQVDESKACHKVWFNSPASLLQALNISFACRLFGTWAAEERLNAEVLVDVGSTPSDITAHAHYMLKIPPGPIDPNKSTFLKNWIILVSVDIFHKPNLLVYWPTVPDRYNVSEYRVRINESEPKVVSLLSCQDGYCFCELFAGYFSRNISVSVQPVHKDCIESCYSYSPVISLETCLPLYFTIPAVLVPIVMSLFLMFSVYYFCCKAPQEPLRVLLLFDSTTKHHCQVVYKLAEFLKEFCRVNCLMDNVEIPLSESKNPYKWLHKSIDEADTVLYVASPTSYLDIRFSEYPNVVYEALALIQRRRSNQTDCRPGHFLVAVPPYCSEDNIPSCLLDVPHFYIPKELNWLLWSLYNQQCWMAPLTWVAKMYLQFCWCPGPMSAYRLHGTRLKGALEIANAHKITEEGILPEGTSFGGTRNDGEGSKDCEHIYLWDLDKLTLSERLGGSLSSKDNVVSLMVDVDSTAPGYNAHKITEEETSLEDGLNEGSRIGLYGMLLNREIQKTLKTFVHIHGIRIH